MEVVEAAEVVEVAEVVEAAEVIEATEAAKSILSQLVSTYLILSQLILCVTKYLKTNCSFF